MRVESVHPGYSLNDVKKNTGFELLVRDDLKETKPPTKDELDILRNEVDPFNAVIGRRAE